jgi:hypothetical protein
MGMDVLVNSRDSDEAAVAEGCIGLNRHRAQMRTSAPGKLKQRTQAGCYMLPALMSSVAVVLSWTFEFLMKPDALDICHG